MCLAVPMRIREIREDGMGVGEMEGACHEVDLSLVADPAIGDYVIVHAGFAIEKLDRAEADERLALFRELAASWEAP
jgi:hydrogenase expression/formation protein HypC